MKNTDSLTGKVLIAMPGMSDPRFSRSVVLICAHGDEGAMGLDRAISSAGGVTAASLGPGLHLPARPGTFVAGEMIDWEAPTGGYLLTTCLATGRHAGLAAAKWPGG